MNSDTNRTPAEIIKTLLDRGIIQGSEQVGFHLNPYLEMPKSLSFDDVALRQGKNKCTSRLDTNTRSEVARGLHLEVPLIAANMSAVTSASFCTTLGKLGALGVLHRAWPILNEYLFEVKALARDSEHVAVSVGAGQGQVELAGELIRAGANVITIDIAQGYSESVIETGRAIKAEFPNITLIVGNTVNPAMMYEVDAFADAVKVGIAQGSVCETKNTAGCTEKQFTAVQAFKEASRYLGLPIISDGSVSEAAHFTKAIAAGANSVMAGRIFARCPGSAADLVDFADGVQKKLYFGMASREAQRRWRGGVKKGTCPEGRTDLLEIGESAEALIERYSGALRSGMTYAGSANVKEFQDVASFVRL